MSCDAKQELDYWKSHIINIQYNELLDGVWPPKEQSTSESANFIRDNQEKLIKDALCNRKQYQGNGNR